MKIMRIEGSKRIRLLPWHYGEPGFLVRQFMLRGRKASGVVKFDRDNPVALSPGTYGAPDPLWDMRRPSEHSVLSWEWFVAPCYEPQEDEVKLVHLPKRAYGPIVQRMLGTTHPITRPELIVERLDEMPGDITLAEALARANPPPETEWLEEPLDVTDLDEGCDLIIRKRGRGIETEWELMFDEPSVVESGVRKKLKPLQDTGLPHFNVIEHLGYPFDLELYLEGCRRNQTIVTDAVRQKLEAL